MPDVERDSGPSDGNPDAAEAILPAGVKTLDDLRRLVRSSLTPEEQALLDQPHGHADPTPEEIDALGPDFKRRVVEAARRRNREREGLEPS